MAIVPPSEFGDAHLNGDMDQAGSDQRLAPVRHFIRHARRLPWFSRLGYPISAQIAGDARVYLDGLGFIDAELCPIEDWEEASAAAATNDWDSAAFEAEEQLRAALTAEVSAAFGPDTVSLIATHLASELSPVIRAAAEKATAPSVLTEPELGTAAAGAAFLAAHQALLVLLASGDEEHPLAAKFRLFEAGRWPIAISGRSLNLY